MPSMKKSCTSLIAASVLAILATAGPLGAQSAAVALKGGTVGLGADVALQVAPRIAVRGGLGGMPFDYEGTFDDQAYTVEPPGRFLTVGVDLSLLGPLRLTGGLMRRSDPVRFEAELRGEAQVGDQTYTSEGTLTGEIDSSETAPYVGLGFGSTVGHGLGVYLDLAVAFTGDPTLSLEASGPITQEPGFQAELERERARAEEDLDEYYRYWPVLSLGLRWGLGG